MLDEMDIQLVKMLGKNGRASYASIARSLGLNVLTVTRRINNLKNSGVLAIQAMPNPQRLGYSAIAIIGLNVSMTKVDEVCRRLKSSFYVNIIVTTFGRFNLLIAVHFPTWEMLHAFISSELSEKGDIREAEIYLTKDVKKASSFVFKEREVTPPLPEIDAIDQKIIEMLTVDGQYSGLQIANELSISASSVSKRLSRMVKNEIIRIRPFITPESLGFHANAIIFLRTEPGTVDDICTNLCNLKEAVAVISLLNGYDVYSNVITTDTKTLYEVIKNKMKPIHNVISMETLICGDIVKRYYGFFIPGFEYN